MKVVVFGLGSMGKRRIRLLKKYDSSIYIFGIDKNEERRRLCEEEFGIETVCNLESIVNRNEINCAFVCSSPLSHSKIITECLEQKIHVFTELNLVSDGYEHNIDLAKSNNLTLFISSTFIYRDEIKKIKSLVMNGNRLLNYSYHVGQYLPDWHPWEKYQDFFVSQKRTNACREIFAIELPWLTYVFGDISKITVSKSKISSLHIDFNDNYIVIIEHITGHKGMLAVDIVSRKAVRNLEIFGEDSFIQWNGSPDGLKLYDIDNKKDIAINLYDQIDQLKQYSHFVVENAYYNEIVAFFDAVNENKNAAYNFEEDHKILKIIDIIEAD